MKIRWRDMKPIMVPCPKCHAGADSLCYDARALASWVAPFRTDVPTIKSFHRERVQVYRLFDRLDSGV